MVTSSPRSQHTTGWLVTVVLLLSSTILGCSRITIDRRHPAATPAVDRLLSDDELLVKEAKVEIASLQEGAMPELRDRFTQASLDRKRDILDLAISIGKPEGILATIFQQAYRDTSPTIRHMAALRSAEYVRLEDILAPSLRPLMWDESPEVQSAAITTLSSFSPQHRPSHVDLLFFLNASSPLVVAAASTAAMTTQNEILTEAAREALPKLVGEMLNQSPLIRAAVIIAIGKYGNVAAPAITPLSETLTHDPVPAIRLQAAIALMRIDTKQSRKIALPALQKFAKSPDQALAVPATRMIESRPNVTGS